MPTPVASISPLRKALREAWSSICFMTRLVSLPGLPHHFSLGTKVAWGADVPIATFSTLYGPAPHSGWTCPL